MVSNASALAHDREDPPRRSAAVALHRVQGRSRIP